MRIRTPWAVIYVAHRRKKEGHECAIRAASRRRSSRSARPSSNPPLWSNVLGKCIFPFFPVAVAVNAREIILRAYEIKNSFFFILIILMTVDDIGWLMLDNKLSRLNDLVQFLRSTSTIIIIIINISRLYYYLIYFGRNIFATYKVT